jgi:hypothetical protein
MHVTHFQTTLGAVALGVDAADQLAVVQDRQRVVAVHALMVGRVDLDPIVVAEQARHPLAKPHERIEGRQERRAL